MEKTIDELTQERDTLMEEIAKLKEKQSNENINKDDIAEMAKLKDENKQLRELIEKQTNDLKTANELVVSTMRNYAIQTKTVPINGEDGKTEEEKKYDDSVKAFDNWINNFKENGVKV